MHDEPDDDLLQYMAWKDESPQDAHNAQAAWGAFFERHRDFVYFALCRRFLGQSDLDKQMLRDMTVDVFRKVFEGGAATYRGAGATKEQQSRRARAWLMQIATNVANNWFRTNLDDQLRHVSLGNEEWAEVPSRDEITDQETRCDTGDVATMKRLLDTLSARERDILIAVAEKYDLKNGRRRRLTSKEIAELAEAHQTTPENVRQIRHRTLKWLEEEFNKAKASQKLAS